NAKDQRYRPAVQPRRQPFLRRQAGAADGSGHRLSRHALGERSLAHDPEKWTPVFRQDHAQGIRVMAAFIALLRAVNVGGTGKLPMSELKAMCEELGFGSVRTYIASGNVVFTSRKSEAAIKAALEKRLEAYAGKPVGVLVRSAA